MAADGPLIRQTETGTEVWVSTVTEVCPQWAPAWEEPVSVGARTLPGVTLDDLEWQVRYNGGMAPRLARLLLEQGHLELLIQVAAERGEWFCADVAAQELCRAG